MWGEAVASLRYHLKPGWKADAMKGVDLVVDSTRGIAIIVTAGSAATGCKDYALQVRHDRGDVIQALVSGTRDTLLGPTERPVWQVWFLVHFLDVSEVRGELAQPQHIADSGFVYTWTERIILPNTEFGDPTQRGGRDRTGPPPVDITINRRGA